MGFGIPPIDEDHGERFEWVGLVARRPDGTTYAIEMKTDRGLPWLEFGEEREEPRSLGDYRDCVYPGPREFTVTVHSLSGYTVWVDAPPPPTRAHPQGAIEAPPAALPSGDDLN